MNVRSRTLGALALGAACALGAPTPAAAADFTTHSKLRVEAGGDALEPGANYSNTSVTTQNSDGCGEGGNSATDRAEGANALGIIGHAARYNDRLSPFRTSDRFERSQGLLVCRVGDFGAFDQNRFWLYKVNHEFAEVGGEQLRVGRDDEVLWYFADFAEGENTGDELDLRSVPRLVTPGQPFDVEAVAYGGGGQETNAAGVTVTGGAGPAVSGADGSTQVIAPADEGLITLRGTREDDIPTPAVTLCVGDDPTDCPKVREEYVGTDGRDLIQGTDAPDLLRLRGAGDRARSGAGADYIYARGGGSDTIVCGPGDDVVKTARGEDEFPADDCEDRRFPE